MGISKSVSHFIRSNVVSRYSITNQRKDNITVLMVPHVMQRTHWTMFVSDNLDSLMSSPIDVFCIFPLFCLLADFTERIDFGKDTVFSFHITIISFFCNGGHLPISSYGCSAVEPTEVISLQFQLRCCRMHQSTLASSFKYNFFFLYEISYLSSQSSSILFKPVSSISILVITSE